MRYPQAQLIVLTGGEPSLFVDDELIKALKPLGKTIAIETNGTHPLTKGIDWVTLSPKFASPGGESLQCVVNKCDELKVVYTGQDLSQYDFIQARHRFLQPCFVENDKERNENMKSCVNAVLQNPQWQLSLQIHRILSIK